MCGDVRLPRPMIGNQSVTVNCRNQNVEAGPTLNNVIELPVEHELEWLCFNCNVDFGLNAALM